MADATVYVGQVGTTELQPTDATGRPTSSWDVAAGVTYTSNLPEVGSIVDKDADPLDAEVAVHRAHQAGEPDLQFFCEFDGSPDPDQARPIKLQSQTFRVEEPPPGEATGGEFTVTWTVVEDPLTA